MAAPATDVCVKWSFNHFRCKLLRLLTVINVIGVYYLISNICYKFKEDIEAVKKVSNFVTCMCVCLFVNGEKY